jgi:hypothetical protein
MSVHGCRAFIAACIVATCWSGAIGVLFAQGGKAEPRRIQFQRGRDSATVRGVLTGDAQTEYAFGARKDQRLTVTLSATPARSVTITARGTSGLDLPLHVDSRQTSSAVLPEDGEYEIWVKRVAGARGRSSYRLTVTIR